MNDDKSLRAALIGSRFRSAFLFVFMVRLEVMAFGL